MVNFVEELGEEGVRFRRGTVGHKGGQFSCEFIFNFVQQLGGGEGGGVSGLAPGYRFGVFAEDVAIQNFVAEPELGKVPCRGIPGIACGQFGEQGLDSGKRCHGDDSG